MSGSADTSTVPVLTSGILERRLIAFVAERYPFAVGVVRDAFREVAPTPPKSGRKKGSSGDRAVSEAVVHAIRKPFESTLLERLGTLVDSLDSDLETVPGTKARTRTEDAGRELAHSCDGFLAREAISVSLTRDERRELLRGMVLTRALDNQLKSFFTGGEVRWKKRSFQGKGFRSLGQEAIYGAALRLRRGDAYASSDGLWSGDVVAPLIRDLGAALGMRSDPETVRMVLSAQMGKAGPPMDGRDLHIGDFGHGILPASAPLAISTLTAAGMAMGFHQKASGQVAVSFIGDGGCSLGEWHEAINLCAARSLPAVFCIQNNQTALSTPPADQTSARCFADKASGYGIPGITVDGTDPEAIAAAFTWAAERARDGEGPALIELVAMRMCGHAHHDDMLYLGKDPSGSWEYPELTEGGYADRDAYAFWAERDPIKIYAQRLEQLGMLESGELAEWKSESEALVKAEARTVIDAPWPDPSAVGERIYASGPSAAHREPLDEPVRLYPMPEVEVAPPFDPKGMTFLEAVMHGVGDALESDERAFVYGQDVGGDYGNAFLLLRPLLETHRDRIVNSTLAEGGILGVCVGASLAGMRPIGEIQFNDFVATGFNQLVNNAAKLHYRWGESVPMVVRMPWGGLRSAGPYHSQNTEPWFYRTPGLKIVVPSTPHDARALLAAAVLDPDPVLYYEHIALYRDPKIKQAIPDAAPLPMEIGKAALRRSGGDLAIISYGAYVHVAMEVAERLAADGTETAVLDLRSLCPLDRDSILAVATHTGKVLVAHEDSRRGGIGESIAAIIQEEVFESLDAPVRVVGALDSPVPYSPPLEEAFLPGIEGVEKAARTLLEF